MNKGKCAIVLVAKYPEKGKVKTRLISHLGYSKSRDLYAAMFIDTVERIKDLGVFDGRFIFYRPSSSRDYFLSFKEKGFGLFAQDGKDLGEVFCHIFKKLSESFARILIIGSDSPTLPIMYFDMCLKILDAYDIVLGPALDGGFYLIGIDTGDLDKKDIEYKKMFRGIRWSTEKTFTDLLRNLEKNDISYGLIPEWYDVDEPKYLELLRESLKKSRNTEYINLKRMKF